MLLQMGLETSVIALGKLIIIKKNLISEDCVGKREWLVHTWPLSFPS